jgi:hypothetical protein
MSCYSSSDLFHWRNEGLVLRRCLADLRPKMNAQLGIDV